MNSNDETAASTKDNSQKGIDPPPMHNTKKKSVMAPASNANLRQSNGLEPEEVSKKVLAEKGGKSTLAPTTGRILSLEKCVRSLTVSYLPSN